MPYVQTANRTIERSPNMAAIGADYRDQQACQESLRRRRERELVALWRQQWGREHGTVRDTEPTLQPITGEALHGTSAIADDGARLDRRCRY